MDEKTPLTEAPKKQNFLGLSKPILIVSTLVIVSALIYKFSTSKK